MSVNRSVQGIQILDADNPDQGAAVDGSGQVAIQNPSNIDAAISTLATETKLEAVRALLQTIDADTGNLDVALSTVATETKLEAVRALLQTIDADTSTLATVDYATQTTLATLATEAKLEAVRALLQTIDVDTSNLDVLLSTRATEATLSTVDGRLTTIDAVLDLIKDTDGIKKITDQLPAGTNEIGKVAQGTKAIGSAAWPAALYDASGNPIAVVLDNSIYRLESRSTIAGQTLGTGAEKKITVIDDIEDSAAKRLQTEALLAPGSVVNIGTSIPADPANLVIEFLKESGGSESMLVDGSVTPVQFSYAPPAGTILAVQDVLVVFTADDFSFDGSSFGPNSALTNGSLFQIFTDGNTTDLFTIKQNEDFLRIPGRIPVINNTGPKDLLSAAFVFGGLIKLDGDAGDYIRFTVRDNLLSTKFKYFNATIYGAEV